MYIRTNIGFGQAPSLWRRPALGASPSSVPRVLSYSEVIDNRISVPAQHSLVRLSKNPATSADAVGMLEEIKARRLAGIYCVNWKKAALRAQRFGKYWWTVIPTGEDAVLMLDPNNPSDGPPLIAFRRELDPRSKEGCGPLPKEKPFPPSPARLDAALLKAWGSYKLWRTSQEPGQDVKCTAMPTSDDQVLAGPQLYGLPPVTRLNNVIPPIFCAPKAGGSLSLSCKLIDPLQTSCKKTSLPRGLKCLPHFHVCKLIPGGVVSRPPSRMAPENMNPGFIDPITDTVLSDKTPGGLQTKLQRQIERYGNIKNNIAVALVDLTGKKLFDPNFAGWREKKSTNGASLAKIAALFAVHQLKFDLNTLAETNRITSESDLKKAAEDMWGRVGQLPKKLQPRVWTTERPPERKFFEFDEQPSGPVLVNIGPVLQKHLECIFAKNCLNAASVLIEELGFPYIQSVLWQSGLFHPKRFGLWLSAHYKFGSNCGPECDCIIDPKHQRHFCIPPKPHEIRGSAIQIPGVFGFNVTALSAATFFTLMAQGRLADDITSLEIRTELKPACTLFCKLDCQLSRAPTKCGCSTQFCSKGGFIHDCALIERRLSLTCSGKIIRYVAVLLTNNVASTRAAADSLFCRVLKDLDQLIQDNNP